MSVDKYIECPNCDEIKIYLTYGTEHGFLLRILNVLKTRKLKKNALKSAVGICPECGLTVSEDQIDQSR
jgi:hypothetical protein